MVTLCIRSEPLRMLFVIDFLLIPKCVILSLVYSIIHLLDIMLLII